MQNLPQNFWISRIHRDVYWKYAYPYRKCRYHVSSRVAQTCINVYNGIAGWTNFLDVSVYVGDTFQPDVTPDFSTFYFCDFWEGNTDYYEPHLFQCAPNHGTYVAIQLNGHYTLYLQNVEVWGRRATQVFKGWFEILCDFLELYLGWLFSCLIMIRTISYNINHLQCSVNSVKCYPGG